jgi:predicted metal-dependent peptidase
MKSSDPVLDKAWNNIRAAEQRIAWETPFHGHNLATMRIVPEPAAKTMRIGRVDGVVAVEFAPVFVASLLIRQAAAVLTHEIHHLIFGHLGHSRALYPNTMARTIAEEVSVNEWIDARDLPGRPVLLEQFPELKPGQSFQERYKILSNMNLREDPRTAGLADELERRERDHETVTTADVVRMAEVAVADLGPEKATKGMPIEKQRAIMQGIGRGSEAGGFASLVPAATGRPVVQWVAKLRRFLGAEAARTEPTYCRPCRRHPEMAGLVPGREAKPSNPRLMIVLDTSGSMTDALLGEVQREIRAMLPYCEAWLVQVDTKVQEVRRLDLSETVRPLQVLGRGGTDFRPALSPALIRKIRPAWILVFTDGHGPAPDVPPPCRLAWVLGGFRPVVPAKYGEVIELGRSLLALGKED